MTNSEKVAGLMARGLSVEVAWLTPYLELYYDLRRLEEEAGRTDAEEPGGETAPTVGDGGTTQGSFPTAGDGRMVSAPTAGDGGEGVPAGSEALAAPQPVEFRGYGAKFKRETYERLVLHRHPAAAIVDAADGALQLGDVLNMSNAARVPFIKWEALAAALDKLEEGG